MKFEAVIGLEVHAELSTKTKIYCGCTTEFKGEQNTHCCPVCMGFPGTLPVLNKRVVDYAIKAGLALNCNINRETYMARKNYFYPDCPKNYQITQDEVPICSDGYIEIASGEKIKKINIERIHMEEDAGKTLHREDGSYIDYNRAGVPLIEIVSKPDISSPEEAREYLLKLKGILQYLEVSDCKMEEGSLRCDANVSIRPLGSKEFGTKTEIKNMNSFKAVERALDFEINRQLESINRGQKIIQETRRWDEVKEKTVVMRSKEEAHDYRYFMEPDMILIKIDNKWIEEIKNSIPELPEGKKKRYIKDFQLSEYDAEIITASKNLAVFFEACVLEGGDPKEIKNWILGEVLKTLKESNKGIDSIKPAHIVSLISLVSKGVISKTAAKEVFKDIFETGKSPEKIVEKKGLLQISKEGDIKEIINKVINDNPQSVIDYKNGKTKAMGYIVGQVMKASGGKANPKIVNSLLFEKLKNL